MLSVNIDVVCHELLFVDIFLFTRKDRLGTFLELLLGVDMRSCIAVLLIDTVHWINESIIFGLFIVEFIVVYGFNFYRLVR